MKLRTATAIAILIFLGQTHARASTNPEAQVTGAKGSVQITLHLYKTKVKANKSLWYKLKLKNIGKKELLVHDWFYKNPWVIHENSKARRRLYLEIIDPKGKPLRVKRVGAGRVVFDWEPKPGTTVPVSPEEQKEVDALLADCRSRGLTEQEQSIALSDWNARNNDKKNTAELNDPAKQLWLQPGASTTTIPWTYTNPGEYADHSTEAAPAGDYTQLWSFKLPTPGTYRIRAVYDYAGVAEYGEKITKKYKTQARSEGWLVTFKTPFIKIEVLP